MNLDEALISCNSLNETKLSQITKNINLHIKDSIRPGDLSDAINTDGAMSQSYDTVTFASEAEKTEFKKALSNELFLKAKKDIKDNIMRWFDSYLKLPETKLAAPEPKKASSIDPKVKERATKMQDLLAKAKTPKEKTDLVGKWTAVKNSYNSRVYTWGYKNKYFSIPPAYG